MTKVKFIILILFLIILFPLCMVFGSVDIPAEQVVKILAGADVENEVWKVIIIESRLPMALTAILAGA